MRNYIINQDGNAWFATTDDFINLQESDIAFGSSPRQALDNYLRMEEEKDLALHPKHCNICGSAVHDSVDHSDIARMV